MPNKLYNTNDDYLVEGAKNKGYRKNSGSGYGDGKTSNSVNNYGNDYSSGDDWFEGKKSDKGYTVKR